MTVYLSTGKGHYGAVMVTSRTASGRTARAQAPSGVRGHTDQVSASTPNWGKSTRERILNSATRLFAERGFESASMPDIAKAAGITAGAIYKHFESKGDLLLEVVMRSFLSSPLFAHGSEQENDATALPHLAAAYTDPDLKLVRQLSIEVHSAASKDSEVGQLLSKSDRLVMDHLSASVASAQKAGKLDPGLNPAHVARAFCTFIMGLIHMDTLLPELVGDRAWRDFIRERVAILIGVR